MDKPAWIMSPQAHRRLLEHMGESELDDLAIEIVRDLVANGHVEEWRRGRAHASVLDTLLRTY